MRTSLIGMAAVFVFLATAMPARAQTKDSEINGKRLEQWIKELADRDASIQENALHMIMRYGQGAQETAGAPLILALGSLDTSVRVNATIAIGLVGLGKADLERGVSALVRLLNDTQAIVRFQSAMALSRLGVGAKSAISKLAKDTINDKTSWEIRKAAAVALGTIGAQPTGPDSTCLNALVGALRDSCSQVRLGAVMSLAFLAPASSKPAEIASIEAGLKNVLSDRDKTVAIGAHVVLFQMQKDKAPQAALAHVDSIAASLKSPDMKARCNAAQALGTLGDHAKAKVPMLVANLSDKQTDAATSAASALVQLKQFVNDKHFAEMAKLLQSTEKDLRARGAHVLAMFGEKGASQIPALVTALKDKEPQVQKLACFALGEIGKPAAKALPAIKELTTAKDEGVQQAAFDAIDQIENKVKKADAAK